MARGKTFPINLELALTDLASAKFKKATAKISATAKKFDGIGKKLGGIGKKLTLGLTLPVLGFGVASAKAAADFEKGMGNVATLVDTSTESIRAMGQEVLGVAKRTPVAISGLTEALFDVRSAGIKAGDAMGVLEKSAQLGVAGLGTTKEATSLVVGAINAFKLKGEEAEAVYDQIFKTTKNGITTIAGLSQGFGAVAGTVAASGTKLDEYLSAVAALTTTTRPASVAHTQLRAVLNGLTRETKESSKVFKTLGAKNFKELIKNSNGLVPALNLIKKELKGDEAAIFKLVGSSEALDAVLALTGNQAEKFNETLADMNSGINDVDVAFAKQAKTSAASFQKLKNSIEVSAIGIGNALLPIAGKVADKIQGLITKFEGLDSTTKEWIAALVLVAAVIGPALVAISFLVAAFKTLKIATIASKLAMIAWKTVIFALKAALLILRGALLLINLVLAGNPIGIAIVAIAAAAALIISNWEPIKGFFQRLWDDVLFIFDEAMVVINGLIKTATEAFAFITGGPDPNDEKARREAAAREKKKDPAVFGTGIEADRAFLGAAGTGGVQNFDLAGATANRDTTTKVQVDFANAPPGTSAGVVSAKGPAKVDLSMGVANGPGG